MVILSAPPKSANVPMIVHGATPLEQVIDTPIVSMASCTTNCVAPIMQVLNRRIGVEKSLMTTTHGYTSTQGLVDEPNKKIRRGRAAAANMVPTSTGAAGATIKSVGGLTEHFDGVALRMNPVVGLTMTAPSTTKTTPMTTDTTMTIATHTMAWVMVAMGTTTMITTMTMHPITMQIIGTSIANLVSSCPVAQTPRPLA